MNYILLTVHGIFTLLSKKGSFEVWGSKILLCQKRVHDVRGIFNPLVKDGFLVAIQFRPT